MAQASKYKDSLNLPKTDFPMRGSLATREPELLAQWEESKIYEQLMEARKDAPTYLLHDGPPYANGNIHYGHILNKILKDLVLKYKSMAGFRTPYVPGWDTHGLPIENAVDRELGKKKREMSALEIRHACRDYAIKFMEIQREEFKRLGIFGEWDNPYLTLHKSYEGAIIRSLAAFAKGGYLYRGKKPVYWCPTHRTALAEAEIEYHEHTSPSIYVRMAMDPSFDPGTLDVRLQGMRLALVIWTTTPWTIPANLAIVAHQKFQYVAIPSPRDPGEYLLVAKELSEPFLKAIGAEDSDPGTWVEIDRARLKNIEGARYRHPFVTELKGENDFKVWFADYVTLEQGTGLVHTAPGHGVDDYKTGVAHGLEVYAPIDDAGRFTDEEPRWQGKKALVANPEIVDYLHELGALLSHPKASLTHQYPHSWRSKKPVLFRATDQWFLSVDHSELRKRSLAAIDKTTWIPPWGRNRIYGMVENRPDWVLSRQRLWGVPIPAFYCSSCEEVHADGETMEHIAEIFEAEGADAWYAKDVAELLPAGTSCSCGSTEFRQERAIVNVWFESGVSWLAVCENNPNLGEIDLYLEGSDQHRGWFHSSLLVAMGVKEKPPYKSVLTHGFVLNEEGTPYSKSEIERARREGRKVKYFPPEDIIKKYGAELFRLWAASTEFRNDIPYSEELLKTLIDWYKKFRNTARFLLGNLFDYSPAEYSLDKVELTEIDEYALARLHDLNYRVRASYDAFEFHTAYKALVDYISGDLSSLYFDVIKDRLYTRTPDDPQRRATQAVLYEVLRSLARLCAPILCFTAEDIWKHLSKLADDPSSVHLSLMPDGQEWNANGELAKRWSTFLAYRELATKELETFRAQKNRSTDAHVTLTPTAEDKAALVGAEEILAELFIVSRVSVSEPSAEPGAQVTKASGSRCERCWKWFAAMAADDEAICDSCSSAVKAAKQVSN